MSNQDSAPRKFDHGKPQINLIPSVALIEAGKVLAMGALKYDRGNWAKGLATSRYFDAAQRHLLDWNAGIDRDPESGLMHLAHALVNIAFMIWNMTFRPDLDDRWHTKYGSKEEPKTTVVELFYAWFFEDEADSLSPVFVSRELAEKWDTQTDGSYAREPEFVIGRCTADGKRVEP